MGNYNKEIIHFPLALEVRPFTAYSLYKISLDQSLLVNIKGIWSC